MEAIGPASRRWHCAAAVLQDEEFRALVLGAVQVDATQYAVETLQVHWRLWQCCSFADCMAGATEQCAVPGLLRHAVQRTDSY